MDPLIFPGNLDNLTKQNEVCQQYITWEEHAHDGTLPHESSDAEWNLFNDAMASRKRKFGLGATKTASLWRPAKRRRMKTYQCVMQLNNMLKTSAGVTLAHFKGPSEAEMSEISAFDWNHLDVAPDQGPDMVCMDFFLCFCVGLNMTFNYDIDHATSNSGKQALKQAGLWSTAVLMAAASNAVYGSTMRNFHFYNDQNVFIVFFNEAGLSGFPFCLDNGSSMDNPWMIHGLSMYYPWIIHGLSMDNPWMIHGLSMVYPWIIHGLSMDHPWTIHGLFMDYPWIIHG